MKTITITLGDRQIEVPKLNIGQIERARDMFKGEVDQDKLAFSILRLALERTSPPHSPADVDSIECDLDQIAVAVDTILVFAGFKKATPGPNERPPA